MQGKLTNKTRAQKPNRLNVHIVIRRSKKRLYKIKGEVA